MYRQLMMMWTMGILAPKDDEPAGGGGDGGDPPADPPSDPPSDPPADPPADDPPADPPAEDSTLTLTQAQLKQRMARDRKAYLRKLGFESEEQLTQYKADREAQQQREEEERRQQMSREQQLQEDLEQERQQRQAAEAERERANRQAQVIGVCAALGIKNTQYATFVVDQARATAEEAGEDFDVEEHLRGAMENEQARAAFGIAGPPKKVGANTTGAGNGGDPPKPPAGGGPPKSANDLELSKEEWAKKQQALGIA